MGSVTKSRALHSTRGDVPQRPRVLIVDDADGMRAYLAALFEARGFEVDTCEDGRRALALLEKCKDDPTVEARLPQIVYQYANSLLQLGRSDEALERFNEALQADPDNVRSRARALVGIGNAHHHLGNEGLAKEFFDQAASLCEEQGDLRATKIIRRATREE